MVRESETHYEDGHKKEECGMHHATHLGATQMGVEAAIAQNEVEHLNAKRIQDEVEDLKEDIREDDDRMMFGNGFGNCGGMSEGLLFGLLAGGGFGWGGRNGHCADGGASIHQDIMTVIRDSHDSVLSLKDDVNRNALREADIRHEDAMRFQCELDRNELKAVEIACKLEKDMACGFKDISDKICGIEKDTLRRELEDVRRKLCQADDEKIELREIIRDNKQTQTLLNAIAAACGTSSSGGSTGAV